MTRLRGMFFIGTCLIGCLPAGLSAQESNTEQVDNTQTSQEVQAEEPSEAEKKAGANALRDAGWKPLLPTKGLKGWEVTDFGTGGMVTRDGELLIVEMGDPLNGITFQGKPGKDFPTDRFEIYLEAKRIEGSDFLCGLTFPVGDEFCSFIAGGWGGGLVGLSNVDGYDASENQTTSYHEFENDRWYKFKVRVTPEQIQSWIDDKEFFRLEREYHEFSTRIEVYACQPLGFCTFQSKVAVRDFRWRPLTEKDSSESPSEKDGGEKKQDAPAR